MTSFWSGERAESHWFMRISRSKSNRKRKILFSSCSWRRWTAGVVGCKKGGGGDRRVADWKVMFRQWPIRGTRLSWLNWCLKQKSCPRVKSSGRDLGWKWECLRLTSSAETAFCGTKTCSFLKFPNRPWFLRRWIGRRKNLNLELFSSCFITARLWNTKNLFAVHSDCSVLRFLSPDSEAVDDEAFTAF